MADHFEKEVANRVGSGGGSRGVAGDPAWTTRQPSQCLLMLPGGVSGRAKNGIAFPGRDFVLDGIEEADVSAVLHPAADLHSIEHAERSNQSVGAMAFIVVHHGLAMPEIDWQTRLSVRVLGSSFFHRAKVPRHGPEDRP